MTKMMAGITFERPLCQTGVNVKLIFLTLLGIKLKATLLSIRGPLLIALKCSLKYHFTSAPPRRMKSPHSGFSSLSMALRKDVPITFGNGSLVPFIPFGHFPQFRGKRLFLKIEETPTTVC